MSCGRDEMKYSSRRRKISNNIERNLLWYHNNFFSLSSVWYFHIWNSLIYDVWLTFLKPHHHHLSSHAYHAHQQSLSSSQRAQLAHAGMLIRGHVWDGLNLWAVHVEHAASNSTRGLIEWEDESEREAYIEAAAAAAVAANWNREQRNTAAQQEMPTKLSWEGEREKVRLTVQVSGKQEDWHCKCES